MSDRIDRERYLPTASTVSHLRTPDPVCMFYFAHPFGGIATPASSTYTIDPFAGMPTNRTPPSGKSKEQCIYQHQHLKDFVPWPPQTWQSRDILTPLIAALQQQIGQNISEFEKVLRTIHELWYAPAINTNITDVQYLQNYYTFIQRQKQLNEQNFDYIINWRENSNVPLNVKRAMGSNAFATNELINTDNNSRKMEKPMMNGTDSSAIMSHRKPYTRLLRRRHSLPEIIMRKHQLATQKNSSSNLNASTAPSPPARERVPASFETSRERTRTSSPISVSLNSSSSSTIVANEYHTSTGSDSNLNRIFPSNGSMRQQLLRRLWHKEYRRFDRTGSLSPPLHRSLRSKRTFRLLENNSPDVCLECQKLDGENFNRSVPEITMKRIKHSSFSSIRTQSTATSVACPRKSYSIETETLNSNSIMSINSSTNGTRTAQPTGSDVSNGNFTPHIDTADSVPGILNEVNRSTLSTSDWLNGNDNSQIAAEKTFLIQMEGDRMNDITMASADTTPISESTLQVSSDDSSIQKHNQSIISRPQKHWHHNNMNDHTNNNNNNKPEHSRSTSNRMDNLNNNVNGSVDSMESTYNAYYMDGDNNTENESSVRLITNETVDQSTLDTIISQILVDSLNNIIVVQGKVNQNFESNSNQTQTAADVSNASSSTSSSLPLPTTDQIYFPHYLSTETLSEYSTKFSNNSSAIELLPSNLVISVISGSSYPLDGGEMVVHRLTDMPRTESMEVVPSSAHSRRGKDKNGNFEHTTVQETKETSTEDDAISLVDSLDNPEEINDNIDFNVSMVAPKSASVERSQAFFIPIENPEKSGESAISAAEHQSRGLEAVIANSLPSHLRERLERRQSEINARKETEMKQRQDKIQKLIHRHENTKSKAIANKETKSSFQIIPNASPTQTVKKLPGQLKVAPLKKDKGKQLRSEIGSLESYTVDAQGNLQFIESDAKGNGTEKVTTVSGPVVKHVAIKKTITTKTTISPVKKVRENKIVAKRPIDNNNRTKPNINAPLNRARENGNQIHDIQKMTLVHHSPSDIITPDNDCGPRRMYQKTEICEGTKRIEILEIVECLNSSPDSLNPIQSSTSSTASQPCSLIERFSTKQSSKIPIPVPIKNRSSGRQSILNATQQRSLRAQIRDSMHTGNNINNSKVDQIIADLLIEALNHSTDIGIEFIKTPQNRPSQSIINKMNNNNNNSKRMNLSTRRTGNVNIGSGKRSAHSSAKYQQVFDAIPEEKSSSLSIDSPSDENCPTTASDKNSKNSTVKSMSEKSSLNSMEETNDLVAEKETSANGPIKVGNGKAAIDSDNDKTAETWFGFFGRSHVDSPIDSVLLDEESTDKKPDAPGTGDINLDSNEVVSPNVSTTESKISISTSIPSEAAGAKVASVDSDSILPIIDDTFETSVTGVYGGNAALEKPYRKNARCSAQNHLGADCPECDAIEKELLQQCDQKQVTENGEPQETKDSKQEMHLQVATIDKSDSTEKNDLSPKSVYSAQNGCLSATTNTNGSMGSGIDCKSFIILHDENENASHFLPNITSAGSEYSTTRNAYYQSKPSNTCDDCCFCNPNLHQSRRDENEGESPKKCNFCSSRQQSNQTTPATSSRFQTKNEPVHIDSARSSTVATDRIYESKYKSSHTHIRTHSRDLDTMNMNTQCTKKTNRLIRRSMHNGIDDILNGNLNKTKDFGKAKEKNATIELNGSTNTTKNNSKKSSIPKLPPPTQNDWHSMDTSSSSSSSVSTGSSNKSVRRQDSKSVPNLPRAERWPNIETNGNGNGIAKTRTNSRYQEFYGNNGNDERTDQQESAVSKTKPAGWTVTVAGTYSDDMAPDVQMHLSFPKRSSSQGNKQKVYRTIEHSKQRLIEHEDIRSNSSKDEIYFDSQRMDRKPAILPPPHSIKLNPKRSLTKNNIFGMDLLHQHQHDQIASNRKFIYDANGNANTLNQRSANEICNLPNVYQHRFNNNQTNRTIAKPSTTKKTIKRSEYSVSVASATTTTRTMSNFLNGKRAMSYQTLNANTYQRFQNPNKSKGIPVQRDHSAAELGQSTYRVSVTPSSQQSSSYYTPTTLDFGDETDSNGNPAKHLSVSGNAIAPERKPPVPTMSERDVTRRHDACFTRTRSIFL